ncbi:MAG: amino acid adenylation domain-containing protein, partial [Verrucomicrobiales bacterium]|nr:amino acid adenylation domain-containing protein [Verrucomicrobiales bacterium]
MSGQDPAQASDAKRRLLEKLLSGKGVASAAPGGPTIPRRASGSIAPQSFHQEQVWTHALIQADRPAYNEVVTLNRRGPLEVSTLERCFAEIVRRHEIWRTTFGQRDGEPIQHIHESGGPVSFPVHDLRRLPGRARDDASRRLATANAEQLFDLERLPLWRGCLVRLEDDHYQLHLSIHQLIMDGVTVFQNLLKEIPPLYDALLRGDPSPLPEPSLQYGDFAAWQRGRLSEEFLEADLRYWRRKLAGPLPVAAWPDEFPRPPVQSFRGATENRLLPSELIGPLQELAGRESASLFMALTAGFVALLHRYTGQEDILLGTPAGNREPGTESLFGYFINMLPLRFDVAGDPTFRELLGRVRTVVVEALAHRRVPFLRILREVNPPRDPSRNPLFQLMITLEPLPPSVGSGWTLTQAEVSCGAAKVDLDLSLETRADGVMAPLLYNPDLFSTTTLHRMVDHWSTLMRAATEDPDARISRLRLLTDEERDAWIVRWNSTAVSNPGHCVPQLFEAHVRRTPGATAVVFDGVPTTYQDLNLKANRLAHRLIAAGAGPETRVGLCLDRSADLLVGLLGIMKAGAAYVPLDPKMPEVRWKMILEDARCPVVVTEGALEHRFADSSIRTLHILESSKPQDPAADADPPPRVSGSNLAYVLFTSGSTGRPKGVEIEHRSLVNLLLGMASEIGFRDADVLLAVTTISFDIAGLELFLPLVCGGRVLLAGSSDVSDGGRLMDLMDRGGATVMQATPSTWRLLVESGWKGRESLRVLVGGEAFPPDLVAALSRRTAGVWNVYGPTETTIWSTLHRVSGREERSVPIGRPLANTQCYVLDARQQPVPPGRSGELYLGGDGLARGYSGRPELTAERFLTLDPGDGSLHRLYRTGDLVRLGTSGALEYLGRLDQQVKVRGYRIELGDVEAALLQIPSITAAVAVVREIDGEAELAAFVIPAAGTAPGESELLNALRGILPGYMIPSRVTKVSGFPLTPNGKVDRLALATSPVSAGGPRPADGASTSSLEAEIASVWRESLGRDSVGVQDNFFALGGHSLQALRMITRLRNQMRVPVALADLFLHPTVSGLAARVRDAGGSGGGAAIPRLPDAQLSRIPATSEQTGLWISHQLAANPVSHNVVTATRLRGPLDLLRLEKAWRRVILRQDILRTRLRMDGGDVLQEVTEVSGAVLDVEDLSSAVAADGAIASSVAAAARVTLDPAVCPAWRLRILRIGPQDHVVVFVAHHILLDEWSLHGLVSELAMAYRLDADSNEGFPELPIRFADFAVWHEERLRSSAMEDHAGYWRQVLDGVGQRLALPSDRPEPEHPTGRGGLLGFKIPAETRSGLEALARSQGASAFVAGLAAWQAWLASATGDRDIVVGTPLAERDRPEVEHLAGLFLQTLPMRILVDPSESFRAMVDRVRVRVTEGFSHAAYPLARMVGASFRRLGARSLFPSLFVLVDRPWPEIQIPGTRAEMLPAHHGAARFDLILSLTPDSGGGWTAELEYSEDRFSPGHAQRLSLSIATFFARVAGNPELPALDPGFQVGLPDGTAGRRRRRVVAPEEPGAPPSNLMDLLESGMAACRDAPAIEEEGGLLTYGEMAAGYDRLAACLNSRNIGPGSVVALCLDRSANLILGVLGILKSGAAYVPVDPSYPPERIAAMLEDSRPAAVVTDRRHADLFGASVPNVLLLEDLPSTGGVAPHASCPARPGDLAYVLFTSGSTGRPKGVAMSHRALINLIQWQRRTSVLEPGRKTLQFAP